MPRRRPGAKKNYNTNIDDHLLFLVEGIDRTQTHNYIDNFKSKDHMIDTWKDNRQYLLNLFFYGTEGGTLGGYGAGKRPAGWWFCEAPIQDIIIEGKLSGVVADEVFIDGQYYEKLKEYAVKSKHMEEDPHQFKLNQCKFLQDHNLLFNWEEKEIKKNGPKKDWITKQAEKIKK